MTHAVRLGTDPSVTSRRQGETVDADGVDRFARSLRFGLGLAGMFLSTVVITLALVAVAATFVPGWHGTVVASGSMEPALRRGDAVIYAERSIDEVGEGTVVVFDNTNGISVIHRVVAVNDDGSVVTRGDANQSNDAGVLTGDRLDGAGRMVVPWIGLPRIWWSEGRHVLVVVTVLAVLVAARSAKMTNDPLNDPWSSRPVPAPSSVVLPSHVGDVGGVGAEAIAVRTADAGRGLVAVAQRRRLIEATAP